MTQEMLFCDSIAADEEKVWLIVLRLNLLVEIERSTGILSPCGMLLSDQRTITSYRSSMKYEKKVLLFPYEAKDICIYDTEKKSFDSIALDSEKQDETKLWGFTGCTRVNDRIVVYGGGSVILLLDLPTFEIHYLNLRDKLPENLNIGYWFWKYSYSRGSKLFLIPQSSPCIIELDVRTQEINYKVIPEKNDVCIDSFAFDGTDIYYVDRKKGETAVLTKYDLQLKQLETYEFGIDKQENLMTFGFFACVNGALWLLPGTGEKGYRYYKGNLEKIPDLPTTVKGNGPRNFPHEFNYRSGLLMEDGHILTIHAWSCQLVDINTMDGSISTTAIVRERNVDWPGVVKKIFDNFFNDVYDEWMEEMFESFLSEVVSAEQAGNNRLENRVGNKIFQVLRRNN